MPPHWVRLGTGLLGALALGSVAVAAVAMRRWDQDVDRIVGRLWRRTPARPAARIAGTEAGVPARFSPAQVAGLPAPVGRYFTFALTPGQPLIARARVGQTGEFAMRPGAWSPFTATEYFTASPPGFVWDASIRMVRLIPVRVRDSYMAGEGSMRGRVAGVLTVVDQHGTPEMAASTLQRYLSEAVWVPTALLPGAGVEWQPVDDTTARATLTDGRVHGSVDFHFGPDGEIVGVSSERYRAVGETQVLTPQRGRFWRYERIDGMMVPKEGEVAWTLPEGPFPYWRARMVDFHYESAR